MNFLKADTLFCVNGSETLVKVLILCAAGMSSGLLVKKMNQYSESHGFNWLVQAETVFVYDERDRADVVLIAPQVGYLLNEVRKTADVPCVVLDAFDYATANCSHIASLIQRLISE